ncbi:hypothetical protein Celal_1171 [Cellulophaga algicola DSM 14237]|uniref:MORN variant repeat-containing protein n=1 Tax=Cellulophaga algicola (strain DSM 14237 / IC166 / ACAM 630) TaxID=688270 RepID=E6X6I0_CELAD|nr:hypothetical protein [Cellulophaga algicola]ADV48486.1 hypothetical protein Celal_1171 [Cellulophaga algicola DSM 14237]
MKKVTSFLFLILFIATISHKIAAQENVLYPQVWFDEKDASSKLTEGSGTITGSAFTFETNQAAAGREKHKAKEKTKVILFPVTEYLIEVSKLQKVLGAAGRVIMTEKAFSYRLEAETDQNGNFTFYKMRPGKYYIQCNLEFVGHAVGQQEVGRTNYYNGYGYYAGSSAIYEAYNYSYNASHVLVKFVEIKEDGEVIEAKLKPNRVFENYKKLGAQLSMGDRCGSYDGKQFGKCTEYYDNGQTRIIAKWKDGAQDGTTLEYYDTGELMTVSKWKNGQLNGDTTYYNKNQSVAEIVTYKNNIEVKSSKQ